MVIVTIFLSTILFAGILLDVLGLNEYLSRGRMRGYYRQFDGHGMSQGVVKGMRHNRIFIEYRE